MWVWRSKSTDQIKGLKERKIGVQYVNIFNISFINNYFKSLYPDSGPHPTNMKNMPAFVCTK